MGKTKHTKAGSEATNLILEVFKLNGALVKSGDRLVKDLDLTSARWQIIGALAMDCEPLTVPQVARRMGLSRQAVQRVANDLVAKQWVTLVELPTDKRTWLLKLTSSGQSIYDQATKKQIDWINRICRGLSPKEISTTTNLLSDLYDRILEFDQSSN